MAQNATSQNTALDESSLKELGKKAKSWPYRQALQVAKRVDPARTARFETGFGPSGLPHMGTFGEVVRTSFVANAYRDITGGDTEIIVFSDDMDGLRKVPPDVPDAQKLQTQLDRPLSCIADPYRSHASFAARNNAMLRSFLDGFGFAYRFISATEFYKSGAMDATMDKILRHFTAIRAIILPSLGETRRASYSPILPLCPESGKLLYVPLSAVDPENATITYHHAGREVTLDPRGGRAKLQWKVDWAARWCALGVDYEMSGEDLTESMRLSSRICALLGTKPPVSFHYQLFHDERGEKISKTKGNGVRIEEWLRYAQEQSLAYFMFKNPYSAKKLALPIIPGVVDELYEHQRRFAEQTPKQKTDNPARHVHGGTQVATAPPISFSLLLTLVDALDDPEAEVVMAFARRFAPEAPAQAFAALLADIPYAKRYYQDLLLAHKHFKIPEAREADALKDLAESLASLEPCAGKQGEEACQSLVFSVGKRHGFQPIGSWFKLIYSVVFGASSGPRLGSFFALIGPERGAALLRKALIRS